MIRRIAFLMLVVALDDGSLNAQSVGGLRAPDCERTQVLVLASPHLAQMPADTKWEGLQELKLALARYAPDLIAVEAMSGELLESYERSAPTYDQVLGAFAGDALAAGRAGRASVKLDRQAAADRAGALLASFKDKPADSVSTAMRKQVALLLAAAYELPSAALQWFYLPGEHQVADGDVPPEVAEALNRMLQSRSELTALGVALAGQLKLQRLHAVDDQSDGLFQLRFGGPLMKELAQSPELAKLQESLLVKELPHRIQKHAASGELLALFRWMNSPAYAKADVDAQWHIFHRTRLSSGLDRRRAGLWEARNLRIAANIRAAAAEYGAKRALVIFGASHKPFLDAYLGAMMDVAVVDADSFLGR